MHTDTYTIVVGERGRVVLPAAMRRKLHIAPGDELIARMENDGAIALFSRKETLRQLRGILKGSELENQSRVDAFIAERRAEAESE